LLPSNWLQSSLNDSNDGNFPISLGISPESIIVYYTWTPLVMLNKPVSSLHSKSKVRRAAKRPISGGMASSQLEFRMCGRHW
jgi:hypothetical protein